MVKNEAQFLADAVEAVKKCLADVPFCQIESVAAPSSEDRGIDVLIRISVPGGLRTIVIEAKRTGEPRIAREAVNGLLRYRSAAPDKYAVLVAPYISPASATIATNDDVGYVDLAGNCRLVFDSVYISREGCPNPFAERRDLRSLYSPKAERVLRTLLDEPRRAWKVIDLAKAAGVSLGQVANVKKLLENREWVGRVADGIKLLRPAELLEEWGERYRADRSTPREYYSLEPLAAVEKGLAGACDELAQDYALAGFSAAARMAPMVRYQRAAAYIVGDPAPVAKRLRLKPVASGANVSIIEPYDVGVLAGRKCVDGAYVASPVQTYLDLRANNARGEEAAQAILEQVIEPQW
jgi:hypothetical protein